ncbi:MAG: hypothetical protein ABRQ37_11295 [Candidatus Eremiobacterota bacterium]
MRRNITFIELIIIFCIIAVIARGWEYKKSESKVSFIPIPTPILAHEEEMKIIDLYYRNCMDNENLSQWASMLKTVDWLNGKVPSSPSIPKGVVKAYMEKNKYKEGTGIVIIFNDGQNRKKMLIPYYSPAGPTFVNL